MVILEAIDRKIPKPRPNDSLKINGEWDEYRDNPTTERRNRIAERFVETAWDYGKRARAYYRYGISRDSAIEISSFALLDAIEKYNPHNGYKFQNFLNYAIFTDIFDAIRDKNGWRRKTRKPRILFFQFFNGDDIFLDPRSSQPYDEVDFNIDLGELIKPLEEKDRIIVRELINGYTMKEAGKKIGVTESRVSQRLSGKIRPVLQNRIAFYVLGNIMPVEV